ncbi:hypothetical protein TNCV_1806081 [Trichonephila clavipes]|nr:hypothetical protein TNCV_1806081 [Trichonephila clavipes]
MFTILKRHQSSTSDMQQAIVTELRPEPTVTGSDYLDALQLWLLHQLKEKEPYNFIWEQDGAPPHWHLSVRN